MLNPVPLDLRAAIQRLNSDPDFLKFMSWVAASREVALDEMLVHNETNRVFHRQGYACALGDLLVAATPLRTAAERHSNGGAVNT